MALRVSSISVMNRGAVARKEDVVRASLQPVTAGTVHWDHWQLGKFIWLASLPHLGFAREGSKYWPLKILWEKETAVGLGDY